jgi:light-regulated signal transduction histidine kinase (bacteriophytochrome)
MPVIGFLHTASPRHNRELMPAFRKGLAEAGYIDGFAKHIVEMHGGRIWVVSTPGKGSTFQMELPTRAQFHKKTP